MAELFSLGSVDSVVNFVWLWSRGFVYFVVQFFRLGLDALGEYSLSGLCVADRKSWRFPLL